MKTFDEAFDIIKESYGIKEPTEKTVINIAELCKEHIINPDFRALVTTIAEQAIHAITSADENTLLKNPGFTLNPSLHTMFVLGLLTGMEMEK